MVVLEVFVEGACGGGIDLVFAEPGGGGKIPGVRF